MMKKTKRRKRIVYDAFEEYEHFFACEAFFARRYLQGRKTRYLVKISFIGGVQLHCAPFLIFKLQWR